jgi:hypothetical protein
MLSSFMTISANVALSAVVYGTFQMYNAILDSN